MNHFEHSPAYYNLVYSDKDYKGEAQYIHRLIGQYGANARSILNLGCGTGKHDFELANLGYKIVGADLSSDMIDIANEGNIYGSDIKFLPGDIRNIRLDKKFDSVISMFNVLGYQVTNNEMISVFETARFHLRAGGIFIFDVWYSPAVYKHPPERRIKHFKDGDLEITRRAEPVLHENENVIDVNYEIRVRTTEGDSPAIFHETHRVRHFSIPEIELFALHCGFELIRAEEFLTSGPPSADNWGISYILKKNNEAI